MKRTTTALMALGLLLLSGCATLASSLTVTPAPTETLLPLPTIGPEAIIGTWEIPPEFFLRLNEDGTFQYAGGSTANLDDQPWQSGRYELEGELLSLITSDDSLLCAGEQWDVEAQLTEEGWLVFIVRADSCEYRGSTPGARTIWKPVTP